MIRARGVGVLLAVVVWALVACGSSTTASTATTAAAPTAALTSPSSTPKPPATSAAEATSAPKATTTAKPSTATSGLGSAPGVTAPEGMGTVKVSQLPPGARDTLRLIAKGGPFPYPQDDQTFGNREGRLPKQPNGYYREYTVETPGSPDRGARRIISGRGGERYYTADHYDSFRLVVDG